MKVPIEQVWEYEFKPTDTARMLHAFQQAWRLKGCEIYLKRRGDNLVAVRKEKDRTKTEHYKCPEIEKGKQLIEEYL